ncbi:hypothetical protein KR093_008667 [Drosophila rubida]|uniref:BUD13 homolog n=1 Tax=Drosophila rubida TaxID=30044 RepID=A0AAD4JU70_9MUSC|nr:hypothetical protein KR093_008667 [Drosophila rubida]
MSTQKSAKVINQKEYLKKYLSGDKEGKKKKKHRKHKKSSHTKVKIIDDDAHDTNNEEMDEDLLFGGEDAPQIVGEYIEENADAVRSKWRNIAVKEPKSESDTETNASDRKPATNEDDLWGRKASTIKVKQELSPPAIRIKQERRTSSSRERSPLAIRIKQEKRSSSRDRDQSPVRRAQKLPKRQRRSDSDQSPPRHQSGARKRANADQSPPRRRNEVDQDQSPVRKRLNSDQSPPRRRRDADQSPPRRQRAADQSPPRRRRDSDQSPSRRRRDSDQSPPRRRRDSDRSPPRRRREADQSPPRRRRDSDQSPPRRRREADQSPPCRSRNADLSPPRRDQRTRQRSSDRSPPSRRRSRSRDRSPGRPIKKEGRTKSRWGREKQSRSASLSPPPTHKPKTQAQHTLDGKKAGLQDAQSLKNETEQRRREEHERFEQMSSEVSGRNAEVQIRSTGRRGRRARDAAAEDPAEQKRKEAHEQKKKELYDRWGKGLKQLEEQQVRHAEMAHEAAKPVARYANDEDLDRHLREQEHADDPMLQYMQAKRKKQDQQSNKPVMPVYAGSYPENRFGIRPGYRWDGVDRSNGYEQRWFDKQNERRAVQDEAYKYSVEDM